MLSPPAGPDCPVFTFEPSGTLSCELPDANSPLAFLDIALLTCGITSFSIGSGVGNGAGGAGGTGGGGCLCWTMKMAILAANN